MEIRGNQIWRQIRTLFTCLLKTCFCQLGNSFKVSYNFIKTSQSKICQKYAFTTTALLITSFMLSIKTKALITKPSFKVEYAVHLVKKWRKNCYLMKQVFKVIQKCFAYKNLKDFQIIILSNRHARLARRLLCFLHSFGKLSKQIPDSKKSNKGVGNDWKLERTER